MCFFGNYIKNHALNAFEIFWYLMFCKSFPLIEIVQQRILTKNQRNYIEFYCVILSFHCLWYEIFMCVFWKLHKKPCFECFWDFLISHVLQKFSFDWNSSTKNSYKKSKELYRILLCHFVIPLLISKYKWYEIFMCVFWKLHKKPCFECFWDFLISHVLQKFSFDWNSSTKNSYQKSKKLYRILLCHLVVSQNWRYPT